MIRADDLARVMVDVALCGTEEHRGPIFENRDIRAITLAHQHQMMTLGR
jgi:hypothetical protein